ncbi:MAG: hypothetical protein AAFN12_03505 [Cyanobacteria bacterium J06560_2]
MHKSIGLALLSLTLAPSLTLTSCSAPTVSAADAQAETTRVLTTASIPTQQPASSPNVSANTTEKSSSTTNSPLNTSPQTLSIEQIAQIESELSPAETLIEEHSFALTLPTLGPVSFVASQLRRSGYSDELTFQWRAQNGDYTTLFRSNEWDFFALQAIAFEDANQDGIGPDIVFVADYITGIGPSGAEPFSVAKVLINDGSDQFKIDLATDELLQKHKIATIDGALNALQEGLATDTLSHSLISDIEDSASTRIDYAQYSFDSELLTRLRENESFCVGVGRCAATQYILKDAHLTSEDLDWGGTQISLIPNKPVEREEAIAYAKILDTEGHIDFSQISSNGDGTIDNYYEAGALNPHPDGLASQQSSVYIVSLSLSPDGKVSQIAFKLQML